jgi:alpha-tubulin suppressor-like RCC1 family protein
MNTRRLSVLFGGLICAMLRRSLALSLVVVLAGCGGGGGGSDPPPPPETVTINGRVYAGAIAGGTVRAYALRNGDRSLVQEAAVGQDGSYALQVSPEVILLEYSPSANATLEDIVTRVTTPLPGDFVLRAVYDFTGIGNRTVTFNVTPWSEIATAIAEGLGVLSAANINLANSGLIGSMQANFLAAKIIDPALASSLGTMPEDANVAILNAMISYMGSVGALGCPVDLDAASRIRCITTVLASGARIDQVGVAGANSVISSGRKRPAAIGGAIADGLFSFGQDAQSAILAGYEASAAAYLSTAQSVQAGATGAVTWVANQGASVLASAANIAANLDAAASTVETRAAYQKLLTSYEQVKEARRVFDFAAISSLVYDSFFISDVGLDASAYSAINTRLRGSDGTQYSLSPGWRTFDWSGTDSSIRPRAVAQATGGFRDGFQYNVFYNNEFLVVAFRGTDEIRDLLSDINIAICTNPQYAKANAIYQILKVDPAFVELLRGKKLVLTGHSLGGGIAAYVAARNPLKEVVGFNPAPLCTAEVILLENFSRDIKNIVISGEILTGVVYLQVGLLVLRVGDSTIYPNPYVLSLANQVDSHGMNAVLFALDAARKANCPQIICEANLTALTASLSGSASIATSSAPFRPTLKVVGAGLSEVGRITWNCTTVDTGAACSGSPYIWDKSNTPERFRFSDTEAVLNPILISTRDKAGSYRWDVVLATRTTSAPPITFTVQYAPPAFNPAALRPLSIPGQVISTDGSSVLTFKFSGTQFDAVQSIEWAWSGAVPGAEAWVKGSAEWNANVSIAPDGSLSVRRPIASVIAAAGGRTVWRISLVSDQGVRATRLFRLTSTPSPGNTPNLVVQNINFSPIGVDPGGAVQLNFALTNLGTATAAASSAAVRINQSSNSEAGPNLGSSSIPSLAVGAGFSATAIAIAPATPGIYRVWVIAGNGDTAGPITAALAAGTLTVVGIPPPPAITSVSVNPTAPGVGAQVTFSVNGTNLQAGYTLSFPGCTATEITSASTTLRQFACALSQAGTNLAGTVVSGSGALLYSFALAVAPAAPPPPNVGPRVAAGPYHSCAITNAGGVKCWGNNGQGQLGDGSQTNRLIPVDVLGLTTGVIAVAAGGTHTCALTTGGGVKCWGYNYFGGLGDNTSIDRLTPVDVVGLSGGAIAIAAGDKHTCAVTTSGSVKCWGYNSVGQLGDGGLSAWSLRPVDVSGLSSGAIAVAAGPSHTCAITSSGGVKCWGWNANGRVGDGTLDTRLVPVDVLGLTSGVIAVSAGGDHTCALTNAGGLKCWGANGVGQLGDGTGTTRLTPVDVLGLSSGVIAIAGGGYNTCALTNGGGAKCWGGNGFGELGDDTRLLRRTPVDVSGLSSGANEVAAGSHHTCVLTTPGGVKCWGYNYYGQVGDGTRSDRQTPVDVLGF